VKNFRYTDGGPVTLEAVAAPYSYQKGSVFVDFEQAGIGLHLRDERWMFNVHNGSSYRVAVASRTAPLNSPVHLAGVFDGKLVRLFVNGEPQPQTALLGGKVKPSDLPFFVGANPGPNGAVQEPFHGRIDAVRLSKGALYTDPFTPPASLAKAPETLILLSFEEGQGDVAKDESGNGYDGKIVGANWVRFNQ
jgi:hypothetical protein